MQPWPFFDQTEIDAAVSVLRSGKVNAWTGEEVSNFESEFASYFDRRFAIAVANGTVALELILHGLGIGANDEVIVTSRSFFASAGAIALLGATPVFADIDRDSQNLSRESIDAVRTPRTRAILLVHHAGWPCEMAAIKDMANEHNIEIIEDCAQAHGAAVDGRVAGSFGRAAAFSFCQDKIMTTGGEGGMVLTDDPELWERCWAYKDHGKSYHAVFNDQHPPGFRWLQDGFGTNWRLTELQAAIGRAQLRKLDTWIEKRNENARTLRQAWRSLPALRIPEPREGVKHAYYKFYLFIRPDRLRNGWDRDRLMAAINEAGVLCLTGGCPEIYREKAFVQAGLAPMERLPTARELGETSLMFQVHPTLTSADMAKTSDVVADLVVRATN